MLKITIPQVYEIWDEAKEEFVPGFEGATLMLEHSLEAVAKWESKWHVPFLEKKSRTREEFIDYIKCMTVNEVPDRAYRFLTGSNYKQITDYMEDSMSAIQFYDNKSSGRKAREKITSDLIYFYMVSFNIPFECEKWHLNRLIALIRICSDKNQPNKKISKREMYERNAAINAANKARFHTKG